MRTIVFFLAAGLCEIGGGYLVWLWLREGKSLILGLVGLLILGLYGVVPALMPPGNPFGRIYAAYGGVFIAMSVFWGWWVDGQRPDARDAVGAVMCLLGAATMMWSRTSR